jgi:hypothetical protein
MAGILGSRELLRIFKTERSAPVQAAVHSLLARFNIEKSLVPTDQDHKLKDIFTQPVSPLRLEHLTGDVSAPDAPGAETYRLVDPARTLKDYAQQKIGVRVTRANYRTGRLEISAYVPLDQFAAFMQKQAWRLQASDPEKIPLGSFRLQVPGNPNAINAGLCSGRFPGVFAPYPFDSLYPASDPENDVLNRMLTNWLESPEVVTAMRQAANPAEDDKHWDNLYASWRASTAMRAFFPQVGDVYVDGGTIDNTPSNSAVDYVREELEREGISKRDVKLELYVIFLDIEPKVEQEAIQNPALYQVVNRTLKIQGLAKSSSDSNTLQTINGFGQRGEELALALKALIYSCQAALPAMDATQKQQLETHLYAQAQPLGLDGVLGSGPEGILSRLEVWADNMLAKKLPLHVEAVKVFPAEMPMSTLQFTERLGYRKEHAIEMLTKGCSDTLWTLRSHLERQKQSELDAQDHQALALARKWMGIDHWPTTQAEQDKMQKDWDCSRTSCVFYSQHCAHGASGKQGS